MELNGYLDGLKKRTPERGIHSYEHQIAKEVCEYLGNMKEFGLWIGVAKRIGGGELQAKLRFCQEKGIKNGRYLLAACRKKK